MKIEIYQPDEFEQVLHSYFSGIIDSRFMQIDPLVLSDIEIMDEIKNYSSKISNGDKPYCSWVTIDGIEESSFNDIDYKFVKFSSDGKGIFTINFSQFIYPMSPEHAINSINQYKHEEAKYVCMIDNKVIDNVENYFVGREKDKLLYLYSIPVINSFNSRKQCYYFADKLVSVKDIRRHIIITQCAILRRLLEEPAVGTPSTNVKITLLQFAPTIEKNVTCDVTYNFASELFDNEYKLKTQNLLAKKVEIRKMLIS